MAIRKHLPLVVALLAPVCGLALLEVAAPAYLRERGFPLDDAWIHATYARELARNGTFAYNPGVPAAGETAPLWAVVMSGLFAVAHNTGAFVLAVKLLGFLLHAVTTATLFFAVARSGVTRWVAAAAAALVGLHPDLVAASVSGMEVPLATSISALLALLVSTKRVAAYAVVGALTFLARPETAMLALVVPAVVALNAPADRRPVLARMALFGALGAVGSALLVAARNLAVTGRPLPSTFYAKVGTADVPIVRSVVFGFRVLLGEMPVTQSTLLLAALFVVAVYALVARAPAERFGVGPAIYLGGVLFIAVSFALVPPLDPMAFYHQRYVLPGLPFVLAALPVLASASLARVRLAESVRRVFVALLFVVFVFTEFLGSSGRYDRLENDARNIDDVQVRLGKHLASVPATAVFWAVDAGASRFFGDRTGTGRTRREIDE